MSNDYWKNRISTSVIDRSDPHRLVALGPGGNGLPALHSSELDEIRRGMFVRSDVGLVNIYDANGDHKTQLAVYLTRDGIEWSGCEDYYTTEEKAEIEAIRARILVAVETYPEMACYLGDWSWMREHREECEARRIAHYEEMAQRQHPDDQQAYRDRWCKSRY